MMKGQSAIEYLATYGWMLLAVATVSTVAYTNIQEPCTESTQSIYSNSLEIQETGLTNSDTLSMSLKNTKYQNITINNITTKLNSKTKTQTLNTIIEPSKQKTININGFKDTQSCNQIKIKFKYDRGTLKNQQSKATLESKIKFEN